MSAMCQWLPERSASSPATNNNNERESSVKSVLITCFILHIQYDSVGMLFCGRGRVN